MAGRKRWDVFISYSRADSWRVGPLVELLRAAGYITFRDQDSIEPGRRWEGVIDQSIRDAKKVFVFWSQTAADSKAVAREYRKAIKQEKKVVPVLLDDTKLPPSLRRYQWIDLRVVMKAGSSRTHHLLSQSYLGLGLFVSGVDDAGIYAIPAPPSLSDEDRARILA